MEKWRGDEWWESESMELMEEMPLKELGEAELERLVRGWRRGTGSWFQRRGEAYWKERSVIRKEDDVDGRTSATKDEERVLRGGWEEAELWWYSRIKIDRNSVAASSLLRRWHQCAHQLIRLVCWVHASLPRTSSQQVQPCLQGLRSWPTDRQTDTGRPRYVHTFVAKGRF